MRRRLYLMRHGAVDYVDERGRPVPPDRVPLTAEGRAQAEAARELLAGVELDRVIASGLPRTMETAELVAPGREIERWPDLREIMGAKLSSIPAGQLEEAFVRAFHGVVPKRSASCSTACSRRSSGSPPTASGTPSSWSRTAR